MTPAPLWLPAPFPPPAEDALQIFEQGASSSEPHAPLLAAWAKLAEQMGRAELAAQIGERLAAVEAAAAVKQQ